VDDDYDEYPDEPRLRPVPAWGPEGPEPLQPPADPELLDFSPVNSRITRGAVLCVVIAAIVLTLGYPLRQYVVARQQIHQLRQQRAQQTTEIGQLTAQVSQWQSKAYIEQQARLRLHYHFPGETLYQVVAAPSAPAATPTVTPATASR
jgi:cell division protein FtsB